ncbi:MAG: hypothetical protein LUH22_11470 [Bacteroides sp.]|nr:hypothetical protein [Bacteroides sp.]
MNAQTKTILYHFLFATLIFLNVSCGDSFKPSWEYQVDNPLDTEIAIQIDGKEYKIPARTTQPIPITQGKHTLTYNGSSVNFVTKVNSNKSVTIMNPTLSNYMLHGYFYINEKAKNKDIQYIYDQNSYEYTSDGGLIKLPVRVLNTLFIDRAHTSWTFGLDEEVKDALNTRSPSKKMVFHKLYRESDYLKELAEELPAGVVFPLNTRKLSEQTPYTFPTESFLTDCEEANACIKEMEDRWNKMIANPSDIFQDVAQLSFYALSEGRSKMMQACSTQFNPGKDDKEFQDMLKRLSKEMTYLTDASSFIVK